MKSAIVAGCNGRFGRILTEKLADAGVAVHGVDLQLKPCAELSLISYTNSSIGLSDSSVASLLGQVDWVLLCVPGAAVLEALPILLENLRAASAIVDISSVKTQIAAVVRRQCSTVGYLSIHPMFPPVADFEGRAIVVTPLTANEGTREFLHLMARWKLVLTEMTPEEHDIATSFVQALPHAALISFGLAIAHASVDFQKLWRISTPIQKTLLAALLRVVGNDKMTHFDLQDQNPFASAARFSLITAAQRLETAASAGSPGDFLSLLERLERMLDHNRSELAAIAASIVTSQRLTAGSPSGDDTRELGIE